MTGELELVYSLSAFRRSVKLYLFSFVLTAAFTAAIGVVVLLFFAAIEAGSLGGLWFAARRRSKVAVRTVVAHQHGHSHC